MKPSRLTACVGAVLLAACSVLPQAAAPPALHDFGLASSAPARAAATGAVKTTVSAPSWLEGTEIHYRLLYDEPTRVRAYAQNRWIAPPAELLQLRLQQAYGADDAGARGQGHDLRLELLDFEQVFEAPQSARMRLRAVVRLERAGEGAGSVAHEFALSLPVAPNVEGAVAGASQAAAQLLHAVVDWADARLANEAPRRR